MQHASAQQADDPGALNAWLMFLGIYLLVVRPIFELSQGVPLVKALGALAPAAPWSKWAIVAVMAASAALNIVAGVLLFARRHPSTVKAVHLALWLAGPVAGLLMLAIVMWARDLTLSALMDSSAPSTFLRTVAVATGWSLHLAFSSQVKARYGLDRQPARSSPAAYD